MIFTIAILSIAVIALMLHAWDCHTQLRHERQMKECWKSAADGATKRFQKAEATIESFRNLLQP